MRFLVDAQLPPMLAQLLRTHGHEAEHVTDIGPADAPDRDLWRFALNKRAVLVTKDQDFSNMVSQGGEAPPVVWVRIGNTRRDALLTWFEPVIDEIVQLVDDGQHLIELR